MTDNSEMFRLADELKILKADLKNLKEQVLCTNAQISQVEWQLSQLMEDSNLSSFIRGDSQFIYTEKLYVSAYADLSEQLFKALRETGNGDLIKEAVNPSRLSAFVKEQRELNGNALPEWLEGLVNVFDKITVTVKKVPKKK